MTIILIGNYKRDRQESMQRFADMLHAGFLDAQVPVKIWHPIPFFGIFFKHTGHGIGKWVGYIDKWLLFPIILRIKIFILKRKNNNLRFHICDHSNAPYLYHLPASDTAITCHDVIAIRSSLGFVDTGVVVSKAGVFFQRWILKNLKKAKKIAAVSNHTLNELKIITGEFKSGWIVIYNAFNDNFYPVEKNKAISVIEAQGVKFDKPFLLHVGSAHPRKNRKLLIAMLEVLGNRWNGMICYAGEPLDETLISYAKKHKLESRISSVVKPDHNVLLALYSCCDAFIFPSFSEGFGWPVIEAQACGAPVIASSRSPMTEVGGDGALYADADSPADFAEALISLQTISAKEALSRRGFENSERFDKKQMIHSYLQLHTSNV